MYKNPNGFWKGIFKKAGIPPEEKEWVKVEGGKMQNEE